MSSYKHKSGAQKRQERQRRVNEENKEDLRRGVHRFHPGVFDGSADPDSQVPLELPQKARDVNSTDDDGELSVDGDAASSQVYSLNVSSIERQGFDIGTLTRSPTSNELEEIVKAEEAVRELAPNFKGM